MFDNEQRRLDGVRLLSGLPETAVRELERRCTWREYRAGEKILDRDDDDRDVYLVAKGRVQIVNYSINGREIAFARIGAGGYFGELAAIDGEPRSASVVALEPCLVASMAPSTFLDTVLEHRELARQLLRRLARIVRACDNRIMDLSTLGAMQRIYLELLHLARPDPAGSSAWIIYPMPAQKEIASQASTARETVTRAISQLAAGGIVERKSKTLYIRDKRALEKLAAVLDPEWGEDVAR